MLVPSDPRNMGRDIARTWNDFQRAVGIRKNPSRSTRRVNKEGRQAQLRALGRDNPITIELKYAFSDVLLTAGIFGVSPFFNPVNFPGWSTIKSLFIEYKVQEAVFGFIPGKGTDSDGLMSVRQTPSTTETIQSTVNTEMARGAFAIPLAKLLPFEISLLASRESDAYEYHQITGTDSTEYGYNKEFGQSFVRFYDMVGGAPQVGVSYYRVRITFRGYKGV